MSKFLATMFCYTCICLAGVLLGLDVLEYDVWAALTGLTPPPK